MGYQCTTKRKRCDDPSCPGWALFNEDWHIERCDTCQAFPDDQTAITHIRGCVPCTKAVRAERVRARNRDKREAAVYQALVARWPAWSGAVDVSEQPGEWADYHVTAVQSRALLCRATVDRDGTVSEHRSSF